MGVGPPTQVSSRTNLHLGWHPDRNLTGGGATAGGGVLMISIVLSAQPTSTGAISLQIKTRNLIYKANKNGPYLGLVIPNLFEMNPLINSPDNTPTNLTIYISGVVHYGMIAGNANPSLNIGDVAVPQYWSHTALWKWQRYGQGTGDELALESNGDYTRKIGSLKFASQTVNVTGCSNYDNLLNRIWNLPLSFGRSQNNSE
ncbi:hypothetical protein TIFTF001_009176 [Ficus carica]|uniref:Uncharacterized protein n=1 Tax=Ficus carica TaxID=3494 RepID=A0AA88A6C4_FICCA|nr:hypothetical protein TIFTF001_009176 [Ficus carica]